MISNSNVNFKGTVNIYKTSGEVSQLKASKTAWVYEDRQMLDFVEQKLLTSPDIKPTNDINGNDCLQIGKFMLYISDDKYFDREPVSALNVDYKLDDNTIVNWKMFNFDSFPHLTNQINDLIKQTGRKIKDLSEMKPESLDPEKAFKFLTDALKQL